MFAHCEKCVGTVLPTSLNNLFLPSWLKTCPNITDISFMFYRMGKQSSKDSNYSIGPSFNNLYQLTNL
jgi:hypothetical protein